MFYAGILLILSMHGMIAYYASLESFTLDATVLVLHWALIVLLYGGVGLWMWRRRRSPGTKREVRGACMGAAIGFGIPVILLGFAPVWSEGLYPITVAMLELPILICSTLYLAVFHPLLPKPDPPVSVGAWVVVFAVCLGVMGGVARLAWHHNATGLRTGDIYCPIDPGSAREQTNGITFLTVYGSEIASAASMGRPLLLGPRLLRLRIAVLALPEISFRQTGRTESFGRHRAIRRGSMSWRSDPPTSVVSTLTYELDGRNRVVRILEKSYPLSDGNGFIVLLGTNSIPTVLRVSDALDLFPVRDSDREALQEFFGSDLPP